MRLSKLEAAAHLGISPTTINRRIKNGILKVEKEPHGSSYKIWVILEDEPPDNPSGIPSGTPDEYPGGIATEGRGQPDESPGGLPPAPPIVAAAVEMARLQEQKRNAEDRAGTAERRAETLEDLAEYHKKLLSESDWRYQELLQELRQSQQNVAALTRALPAPAPEPEAPDEDHGSVVVAEDEPGAPQAPLVAFRQGMRGPENGLFRPLINS